MNTKPKSARRSMLAPGGRTALRLVAPDTIEPTLTDIAAALTDIRTSVRAIEKQLASRKPEAKPRQSKNAARRAEGADLIRGFSAIGAYLGGQSASQARHLAYGGENLPIFNVGRAVCARMADLDAWLDQRILGGRA